MHTHTHNSHWTFPSVDALFILLRIFQHNVVSTWRESILGLKCICATPYWRMEKKGATVPLPCLILCRLFAWGNCCGIYCCCILAHMFLKACSLTAEAPFFLFFIFFSLLGRSFVRSCTSDAAGSVICKLLLLLLLFSPFFFAVYICNSVLVAFRNESPPRALLRNGYRLQ